MAKRKACLYLDSSRGSYVIKNQAGEVVPIDDAKAIFESGELDDWNIAFDRLARQFHFDVEALKAYYAKAAKADKGATA